MCRLLPFLFSLLLAGMLPAQSCLLVEHADGSPATGIIARSGAGIPVGTVDALGLLCLNFPPDTLVLEGPGIRTVRTAWADAMRPGRLVLEAAELEAVAILPHWPPTEELRTMEAVGTLGRKDIRTTVHASLRGALQWVPGVQMDQRGFGGSSRLSIRGSLLRSPYGTRGVKVYWGPFPITLADGSTPMELLDPALTGSVDVVRSIGGAEFGSAPAGLLLATAPLRQDTG